MEKIIGIYCITNKISGMQYVGQSRDCKGRIRRHFSMKKDDGFHSDIQVLGKNSFTYQILEECSREELDDKERYWIKELNSIYPYGYNITPGGIGGKGQIRAPFSEEHRRKLSEVHKGRTTWNKGKTLSEETKCKLSESNKGRTLSEEIRCKMSEAHKGMSFSEEHKQHLREAWIRRKERKDSNVKMTEHK